MNSRLDHRLHALARLVHARPRQRYAVLGDISRISLFFALYLRLHVRRIFIALTLIALLNWLWIFPHDPAWALALRETFPSPEQQRLSTLITDSGDWLFYVVPAFGIWLFGTWSQRRRLQIFAIGMAIAVAWGSAFTDTARACLGRPRPKYAQRENLPDRFRGFSLNHRYQSMPSGHSTASFACATPFFCLHPILGVPMTAYAVAIATSRVHLRAHNPSDVIMGASIGVIFALPMRRLMRQRTTTSTTHNLHSAN